MARRSNASLVRLTLLGLALSGCVPQWTTLIGVSAQQQQRDPQTNPQPLPPPTMKRRATAAADDRRGGEADALDKLGDASRQAGKWRKAVEYYSRALTIRREIGDRAGEGVTLAKLMELWKGRQQIDLAIFCGKLAVNAYQEARANGQRFVRASAPGGITTVREATYRPLTALLATEARLPEAQQVIGMQKEEEYFDYVRRDVGEATRLKSRAALTPGEESLNQRFYEIADRVAAIGRERGGLRDKPALTPAEEQRLSKLEADLEVAGQAFQQFLVKLGEELGGTPLAAERLFQLRESQGLMDTLRELGANSVAIYTVVGADKYRVILITPEVQKAAEYPITAAALNAKVAAFREALQDPRLDPRPLGRELYDILVGPLAGDLRAARAETLMWSLDGALRYLPLAALHDGERYLLERYRNVVFTPASRDRLKDQPSARWRGLGFGVSKAQEGFGALPGVAEELRGVISEETAASPPLPAAGGFITGRVMLDEAFTAEALKASLRQRYPLVHIASHFRFKPGDETDSFLLLGDGTRLSLAQLKASSNLFSGVELLTLSACDTATGSGGADADGREIEGFAVLAQRQGAKAVVASLWPVADASTKSLMQAFYRLRQAEAGTLKAEALRRAQLALLRGEIKASAGPDENRGISAQLSAADRNGVAAAPRFVTDPKAPYAHPYYWAPFILIGNWR